MKSSTQLAVPEAAVQRLVESDWSKATEGLGEDFEESARRGKAMLRGRKVKGASNLLRLILAYAVCDWSLRLVGAWAAIQGIAQVSDVALLYRFRQSSRWLGMLLVRILQRRNQHLVQQAGVQVRILDATVISRPGSIGTDWRIHLSMSLESLCIDGVEVTDAKGGESLARFACRRDEIWIGDRGYGYASSIGAIIGQAARLVVRLNWNSLPMRTEQQQGLKLIDWLKTLTVQQERPVWITTPQGPFLLRLIACPLPTAEAARSRERVRKLAAKKGKQLNANTWLAAGFVILVTNLPTDTWEAARVLWLYRLRWQIELRFKQLKSLLQLDHLRAQDPRLAQTYLLAKLLAALLLEQLVQQTQKQVPDWFLSTKRPVSLWRLQALFWWGLRQWVAGSISLVRILAALPTLQRYVCDPPRSRCQQLAWARSIIRRLSVSGV